MGVMHEVRGHLKGKADWIVCGHRVLQPHLIILEQRDTINQMFLYLVEKSLAFTYQRDVHHVLHKSSCQLWFVLTLRFLNAQKEETTCV